jgi:hypothetical protein
MGATLLKRDTVREASALRKARCAIASYKSCPKTKKPQHLQCIGLKTKPYLTKKMEQHYRMTLQDAIERYHAGDITIKGLIHFYILIKCKPGWKIKIDFDYIKQILPVSKSLFYHVISCLKKEGVIAWEAVKGILVSRITPETDNDINVPSESYTEPDSRIPDSQSRIPDYQSRIPDYEPPKPSTQNDCGDSPVIKQSLDQLLNNSLSTEQERENFIEFGKKKAASLPTVPALPLEWIRSRFTEL